MRATKGGSVQEKVKQTIKANKLKYQTKEHFVVIVEHLGTENHAKKEK